MKRLLIVMLLLGVSGAAHAQAKGNEARAKQLFALGNKAFDEARYSDALAAYKLSFELVPRPSTVYNIAKCRDYLGDYEGALVDYERFVVLPGGGAALIAEANGRLTELRKSVLIPVSVSSQPAGAEIRVDGNEAVIARTPASLSLTQGKHEIRFAAALHRPASRPVEVFAGKRDSVSLTLEPIAGLLITVEPGDAAIEIRGRAQRAYGHLETEVDPGTYSVTVRRAGYVTQTFDLEATPGAMATRRVTLDPERVASAPVVPLPPPMPSRDDGNPTLRWTGVVVGVVGLVGVAFGVQQSFSAQSLSDQAQMTATIGGHFDGRAFSDAQSAETRSFILYGVGGGLVATGAVLFLLGNRSSSSEKVSLVPVVGGDSLGVAVSGGF